MHVRWLLAAAFCSLLANAQDCAPALGTAIRQTDCAVALNILLSNLIISGLSIPRAHRTDFARAPRLFTHSGAGDPLGKMPQGAQYESCAVAIDINPLVPATAIWSTLLRHGADLVKACAGGRSAPHTRGLGGTWVLGAFVFLVVDPGEGLRNIQGTCMSPRPPYTMSLLGIVTERVCGFQHLALNAPMPDRTQLPPAPNPLPILVNFQGRGMVLPYRARGQWVWNADVWSPCLGNAFRVSRNVQSVWILVIGSSPRALFSRTIPRAMGNTWVHVDNGARLNLLGAWGSRASTWMPLLGDISYLGRLLQNWDWILLELGGPDPSPVIRGSQQAPNATTTSSTCATCSPGQAAEASAIDTQALGTADEEEAIAGLLELAGAGSLQDQTVPESSAMTNQLGNLQLGQGTSAEAPLHAVGGALDSGPILSQGPGLSGFMSPSSTSLATFPIPLFAARSSFGPKASESSIDSELQSLIQANQATPTPDAQPPPDWPSELGPIRPSKRPRPNS